MPDYRHTSDAFSSPPVRAEPVEALHAQGKPWLRRAQPERMQGSLRQVTHQAVLTQFSESKRGTNPGATQAQASLPSVRHAGGMASTPALTRRWATRVACSSHARVRGCRGHAHCSAAPPGRGAFVVRLGGCPAKLQTVTAHRLNHHLLASGHTQHLTDTQEHIA